MNASKRFTPVVRERAVPLVLEHDDDHPSQRLANCRPYHAQKHGRANGAADRIRVSPWQGFVD